MKHADNKDFYKGAFSEADVRGFIASEGSIRAAAKHINTFYTVKASESGIRAYLANRKPTKKKKEDNRPIAGGVLDAPDARRKSLAGTRFVFTSAQNNTHVHENFLASLLRFCGHNDAQLVVSRFTYNKSGFQNGTKDDKELWYDTRLTEFFLDESAQVSKDLIFCGELDILPTASNPLSGFEGYSHNCSGIIPHAKVAMQSLPRMAGEPPRFLYTTGAITLRNYIQRKAGQKAEFHHVFGALYVEIDDKGDFFARQLIADNSGTFYDLTTKYTPEGVETGQEVLAVNYGDIHIEKMDENVLEGAWGNGDSILNVLQPQFQFIHDLTDFSARNHHNIHDPYFLAEKHFNDADSVEQGIQQSAEFLEYITRKGNMAIVVESNHDLAFHRWLKEADIRTDPENAEYFHRMNALQFKAIRTKERRFSIYETALREKFDLINVEFLREDDSFVIGNNQEIEYETGEIVGGIECGLHGHRGPNGSRGSARNLRTIGRKINLGHSHSAGIIDGAYVAGVSGLMDMGYNKGPSSWSHSHIITYQNGKRAIITMRGSKWRA
jgi:hypothetical protein